MTTRGYDHDHQTRLMAMQLNLVQKKGEDWAAYSKRVRAEYKKVKRG